MTEHCPTRALELPARIERICDVRRWAFYSIGAQMCATDTGVMHGPECADEGHDYSELLVSR